MSADAVTWALAEIDALRARVVVAEEALRVAHEDADRLFDQWCMFVREGDAIADAVYAAHRVAVSSRPKAQEVSQ